MKDIQSSCKNNWMILISILRLSKTSKMPLMKLTHNIRTSASKHSQQQLVKKPLTQVSSTIRLLFKLVRARANSMRSILQAGSVKLKSNLKFSQTRWKTSRMTRRRDLCARRPLIWVICTIISIYKLEADKCTLIISMLVSKPTSKLWPRNNNRMRIMKRKPQRRHKLKR